MTEEEKKIVSQIKDVAQYKTIIINEGHDIFKEIPQLEQTMVLNNYTAKVLYDLIEKQQRIMKSQENIIIEQEKEIDKYTKQEFGNLFNGRYISKDKIRDKIKEYREQRIKLADGHFFDNPDNTINDYVLYIAQELLKQLLEEE